MRLFRKKNQYLSPSLIEIAQRHNLTLSPNVHQHPKKYQPELVSFHVRGKAVNINPSVPAAYLEILAMELGVPFAELLDEYARAYEVEMAILDEFNNLEIDKSQYYIGFRAFKLTHPNTGGVALQSTGVQYNKDWHPGECIASCRKPRLATTKTGLILPHGQVEIFHEAPNLKCHCGLHGCHNLEFTKRHAYGDIYAAIQQWGRMIQHTDGVRSQYAQIIAFYYDAPEIREADQRIAVSKDWTCVHGLQDCSICGSVEEHMLIQSRNILRPRIPVHIKQVAKTYDVPLYTREEKLVTYSREFGNVYGY